MPEQWTLLAALCPLLSQILAIAYALYILAYPPQYRCPAFLFLCVPVFYAFIHHLSLTPWYSLNDTFGRMLYIWLAYMSYAFLLVRITPPAEQAAGWRARLRWAGKVLYTRHLGEYFSPPSEAGKPRADPSLLRRRRGSVHRHARFAFCARHFFKAVMFLALNHVFDTYVHLPAQYPPASFLRRVPSSLAADEIKLRVMMTWDVCIADMLYFESVYSVFAILWVGIFRFDDASEWTVCLFGPLGEAHSVRRYWGVYWHDFINASFTGHAKVVTRRWVGLARGSCVTRVVENGLVFLGSGLLHSLVRCVQTEGGGEVWTVALWYAGQMLAVVVEGVVQHLWCKSSLRKRSLALIGERMLVRAERVVGYSWVLSWMFWSVPKYLLTRHAWELESLRRRYPKLFAV